STCERNGFDIPAAVAVSSSVRWSLLRSALILLPSTRAAHVLSSVCGTISGQKPAVKNCLIEANYVYLRYTRNRLFPQCTVTVPTAAHAAYATVKDANGVDAGIPVVQPAAELFEQP